MFFFSVSHPLDYQIGAHIFLLPCPSQFNIFCYIFFSTPSHVSSFRITLVFRTCRFVAANFSNCFTSFLPRNVRVSITRHRILCRASEKKKEKNISMRFGGAHVFVTWILSYIHFIIHFVHKTFCHLVHEFQDSWHFSHFLSLIPRMLSQIITKMDTNIHEPKN